MANEAENAIYNRLAAAPTFHPACAELFAMDWALEPGDIVTVKSGAESYVVPIYSMSLDWKGTSKVTIESTGNERREPLPALKRQQYSGGAAAHKELKRFTAELIQYESDTDAKIGLVVSEVSGQNVVNAASIVASINAAGSTVSISADKINLNGDVIVGGPSGMEGLSSAYGNFGHVYAYDESHFLDDVYMDQSLEVQSVAADYVTTDVLVVYGPNGYTRAEWKQKTIDGVTINYLGTG